MEKTKCQRCFHYDACCAIDLTGALGNPEAENTECEYFVDSERVKIQDKAHWREEFSRCSNDNIGLRYYCSHCNWFETIKMYKSKEWDDYYSERYRDSLELPKFCKQCGSIVEGIVRRD